MHHTYEVFVDIKEFASQRSSATRMLSARYEVDAESKYSADYAARGLAGNQYPSATEYDVRVTRMIH